MDAILRTARYCTVVVPAVPTDSNLNIGLIEKSPAATLAPALGKPVLAQSGAQEADLRKVARHGVRKSDTPGPGTKRRRPWESRAFPGKRRPPGLAHQVLRHWLVDM